MLKWKRVTAGLTNRPIPIRQTRLRAIFDTNEAAACAGTRCAQNIFHLLADRSQWRAATKQNVVESIRTVFALQRIPILHTTAHGFCTNLRSQLTAYSLSLSLWFNWRSQQLSFTPFLFLLVYTNGLPYCVHSPTHPNAVCYGFQRHRMCSSILSISIWNNRSFGLSLSGSLFLLLVVGTKPTQQAGK